MSQERAERPDALLLKTNTQKSSRLACRRRSTPAWRCANKKRVRAAGVCDITPAAISDITPFDNTALVLMHASAPAPQAAAEQRRQALFGAGVPIPVLAAPTQQRKAGDTS